MTATIHLEVPIEHAALLRRTLALAEELHQLALAAPEGTVFEACEAAVVPGGRGAAAAVDGCGGSTDRVRRKKGLRLKARGARWRRANVPAMASLVCVRHSTNGANYWKSPSV